MKHASQNVLAVCRLGTTATDGEPEVDAAVQIVHNGGWIWEIGSERERDSRREFTREIRKGECARSGRIATSLKENLALILC